MDDKNLKPIYNKYLALYKAEGVSVRADELRNKIIKAANEAKENYFKIKEPRTISLGLYIAFWVEQSTSYDFAKRKIEPIHLKNPPALFRATASFHLLFSKETLNDLRRRLFDVEPNKRKELWSTFKMPLEKMDKYFKEMIKERNSFAMNKGYLSRIDMALSRFKIPAYDYKNFVQNLDRVVDFCNRELSGFGNLPDWFYSEFNTPCFICQIPNFPFDKMDKVFDYVAKKYEILDKFASKIKIKLGNRSGMVYEKETDSFKITIDKSENIRHQIANFIHELSHVISYLQDFKKGINPLDKGVYLREKEAIKIEMSVLKKLSTSFYRAFFLNETLLLSHRTLFEIELFNSPDQDLSRLYAKTFNRCFKAAKQKANPLYIMDARIVFESFSSLPYAVAHANLLLDLKKLKKPKNAR